MKTLKWLFVTRPAWKKVYRIVDIVTPDYKYVICDTYEISKNEEGWTYFLLRLESKIFRISDLVYYDLYEYESDVLAAKKDNKVKIEEE